MYLEPRVSQRPSYCLLLISYMLTKRPLFPGKKSFRDLSFPSAGSFSHPPWVAIGAPPAGGDSPGSRERAGAAVLLPLSAGARGPLRLLFGLQAASPDGAVLSVLASQSGWAFGPVIKQAILLIAAF